MKKSFLLLAAMCCFVINLWASDVITPRSISNGTNTDYPHFKADDFKSRISVTDGTLNDWKNIRTEHLTIIRKDPAATKLGGIDSVYVYCDRNYLNLQVWPRLDSLPKRDLVPFHIYLNADNNNRTGGYDDYFLYGNAEVVLEGYLFQDNQSIVYDPAMFIWWGAYGEGIYDQTTKTGWWWTDPAVIHSQDDGWGAIIPFYSGIGNSQALNGNKVFEIQISRQQIIDAMDGIPNQSLVAGWNWADEFTIGFDIEMEVKGKYYDAPWVMQGVLPSVTEDDFGFDIKSVKAKVKTNSEGFAEFDGITYDFKDGVVSIKECDKNYSGNLIIPACVYVNDVLTPVTTIEESAFESCFGLTSVTIPNSITTIGNNAFKGCYNIRSITSYAILPPILGTNTFSGLSQYTKTYVLVSSLEDYQFALGWRDLNLLPIGGTETPVTKDEVTVAPQANQVTLIWPQNDQAAGYSIEITKDGVVFCTLKFNAQGQLTGIAFAPSRDGEQRTIPAAEMTAKGWQFTVTGLSQASKYGYTLDALNASQQSIKHYQGEFYTDGYTGINRLTINNARCTVRKFIRNNQLHILRNGKTYDAQGRKL